MGGGSTGSAASGSSTASTWQKPRAGTEPFDASMALQPHELRRELSSHGTGPSTSLHSHTSAAKVHRDRVPTIARTH